MTEGERVALRRKLRDLTALPPETEDLAVAAFVPRVLPIGRKLNAAGDVCEGIGFVEAGLLVSHSVLAKKRVSCDIFAEGDFATDYVSFLRQAPSTVDIVAVETCSLLWLSRAALNDLYRRAPATERLGRLVAEAQFLSLVARISGLLNETPLTRYQAIMADRLDLAARLPQYELAGWLGVTPESLSRIRGRLARQRIATAKAARVPSKSTAPSAKDGGPKVPRAPREKP